MSPSQSSRVRLHVNIDHVATLRNARGTDYPSPLRAAQSCMDAGADGITAHLREDRRHIRDLDVTLIGQWLRVQGHVFNLEMAATAEMLDIALQVQPTVVTLVPERREERTTEGGLAVAEPHAPLGVICKKLRAAGIKVSLFIAADPAEIEASAALGVQQIELHTGEYAHAVAAADAAAVEHELGRLQRGAALAKSLGLEVAAGHGLTLDNVGAIAAIAEVEELNIGHALISDAVFLSLRGAVEAMRAAMAEGSSP